MKKHIARLCSWMGGFLLSLGCALAVLLLLALNTRLYTRAALQTVSAVDAGTVREFCTDTMNYLRGTQPEWNAAEILSGAGIPVSDAFAAHMAEVRGMVNTGKLLCAVLLAAGLLCAAAAVWQGFRRRAWRCGVLVFPMLLALAGIWCAVDFTGFWYLLHKVLIPGGIFPASERIMSLFPASLFSAYVLPVAGGYAVLAAVLLLVPMIIKKKESET